LVIGKNGLNTKISKLKTTGVFFPEDPFQYQSFKLTALKSEDYHKLSVEIV
jgi:hypothetical protein